jgi:hypothetical protein
VTSELQGRLGLSLYCKNALICMVVFYLVSIKKNM